MSVICMRDFNSFVCACTAKILTWLDSRSSAIGKRQIGQRTGGHIFQHPGLVPAAHVFEFVDDGGRDFQAHFIGDDRDFFRRQHAQTHAHGIPRPWREFGIKGQLIQLSVGLLCRSSRYSSNLSDGSCGGHAIHLVHAHLSLLNDVVHYGFHVASLAINL